MVDPSEPPEPCATRPATPTNRQPSGSYTQEMRERALARIAKRRANENTDELQSAYIAAMYQVFMRRVERLKALGSAGTQATLESAAPEADPTATQSREPNHGPKL